MKIIENSRFLNLQSRLMVSGVGGIFVQAQVLVGLTI